MRTIRVFVSSPSDVREERQIAQAILKKLELRFHSQARFDIVFWETELYDAKGFIQTKLPRPGTFDIVVVILWSTLGGARFIDSETGDEFASGTRFEIVDAMRGHQGRRPTLLICRCMRTVAINANSSYEDIQDSKRRWDDVQEFFSRGILALGVDTVNHFESAADFAVVLEKTLVNHVKQIIIGSPASGAPATAGGAEPYKGLRVFNAEDHGFFFGRSRAVLRVVDGLRRQDRAGRPFLLVFGRSGVGKSSFVRAGVVPHIINAGAVGEIEAWRTAIYEPSDSTTDLVGGLAVAICRDEALPELAVDCGSVGAVAATLRTNPQAIIPALRATLMRIGPAGAAPRARLLLIIDPFEEIFTRRSKADEVAQFALALRVLCESRFVWVLGTVRVDFYARCTAIEDIRALEDGDGHFNLPPLTYSELREVVIEPADRAEITFEHAPDGTSLADELANAAFNHSDPLPLLAYALQQLHEKSNAAVTGVLTYSAFAKLGHFEGLLTKRADEARNAAINRMKGDPETTWDNVFARLVSVDREGRRVRLYARPEAFDDEDSNILLRELDTARLIITDKDDQGRTVISIAHETMLREWESLSSWIEHRESMLRLTRTLKDAAEEWIKNERASPYLILQDARLATAEEFVQSPGGLPVPSEVREFVEAHVQRRDVETRRQRARTRIIVSVLSCAFVIAAGMATVAAYQKRESELQSRRAESHADSSQKLADFMLDDLKDKLDLAQDRDKRLVDAIANRLISHYTETAVIGDSVEEQQRSVPSMKRVVEKLAKLEHWEGAIAIQRRTVEIVTSTSGPTAGELEPMYTALGDWSYSVNRPDEAARDYESALAVLRAQPSPNMAKLSLVRGKLAGMGKREGRYTTVISELRKAARELEALGEAGRAELPAIYDGLAENLRYAGRIPEAKEVYDRFVLAWESRKEPVDPKYQIEYGVVLGLVEDFETAITRMTAAIESQRGAGNDIELAQFKYKLARVLTDAGRLDEAEQQLSYSRTTLRERENNSPRLAKCLEASATLRLRRGQFPGAVEDAREVVRIREAVLKNKLQRDFIEAYTLLAECLDKNGDIQGAADYRRLAQQTRRDLFEREAADAKRLNEAPPNFDPPPSK